MTNIKSNLSKIIVDIGSSTIKVYKVIGEQIELIAQKSVHFKIDFNVEIGLSRKTKDELFEMLKATKNLHENTPIRLYATGIFRSLSPNARVKFIDEVYMHTGLFFNIINHELESFYLEMALASKCPPDKPVLLLNIGGGSTELVIMYKRKPVERHNLNIGVSSINTQFSNINDSISGISLNNVMLFIQKQLPSIKNIPQMAIYNGGELTYMKLAGYHTERNSLFYDDEHPIMMQVADMKKDNKRIFSKISITELESLMPHDPKWMRGARACSAIAQAVCETYKITHIVPSDSNTIHGIIKQQLRNVVLSGSFRNHIDYILKIKKQFKKQGVCVLSPRFVNPKNPGEVFVIFTGEEGLTPLELERYHLNSIKSSDALVICCPQGYVGASAMIEIGYAHALGKRIIFTEKPNEFMLETLPSEIGFI